MVKEKEKMESMIVVCDKECFDFEVKVLFAKVEFEVAKFVMDSDLVIYKFKFEEKRMLYEEVFEVVR